MNQKHDSLLAKIFQAAAKPSDSPAERDKAAGALQKFLDQLDDEELKQSVRSVFAFLQARRKALTSGKSLAAPFEAVEHLRTSGFPASASSTLAAMDKELAGLELKHIRLIAFREATIDNWIKQKAGKDDRVTNSLKESLIELAISDPQMTLGSALYSWFARNLDASRILESKPLLIQAAARHHPKAAEMFAILLPKDKSGDFVIGWICDGEERLKRLVELSQIDSRLFDALQKAAPTWLKHGQANLLVDLYRGMHSNIGSRTGSNRAESTAQLFTLAGVLLPLAEANEAAAAILEHLQTISLAVWKDAGDSPDRRHTWAIIRAGNDQLDSATDAALSPESASILGLALRKSRKGRDAITELESALVNIGVERFEVAGSSAIYDPLVHDDIDGGLLPGDRVIVSASGFRFNGKVIVKAPVTESEIP
jgi:hypothetical protein